MDNRHTLREAASVATGRQLIERAAREPMAQRGWRPRAAGWFTRTLAEGMTAVVAIGTASEHHPRGVARVDPYVGLRVEALEPLVARLAEVPDPGYRQRTVNTYLEHLDPGRRAELGGWVVDAANADEVAALLAAAVEEHGLPFLRRAAGDAAAFFDAFEGCGNLLGLVGVCRTAVVLATHGRPEEALAFLDRQEAQVAGQTNPYAVALAPALVRTRDWVHDSMQASRRADGGC